jgi:hypothetical protein
MPGASSETAAPFFLYLLYLKSVRHTFDEIFVHLRKNLFNYYLRQNLMNLSPLQLRTESSRPSLIKILYEQCVNLPNFSSIFKCLSPTIHNNPDCVKL